MSIFILTVTVFVAANTAFSSEKDKEAVWKATAQFYAALDTMFTGHLGPMKKIWSHTNEVTYMDPRGGCIVGWDQVLASWNPQAAMKLGSKVEASDMQITICQDLADLHNYDKGDNTDSEGKIQKVPIRRQIYSAKRKESGK